MIQCDPYAWSKDQLHDAAMADVVAFLTAHEFDLPAFRRKSMGDYGWYESAYRRVTLNYDKCRPPTKTPGFAWSFPGYKADRTVAGVLAHEVGHHVHFEMMRQFGRAGSRVLYARLKDVRDNEAPVSGYEPNAHETFAESMKLFILNPSLLAAGRPMRFALLREMGLTPLHDEPWRAVLKYAHANTIRATEHWITSWHRHRRGGSVTYRQHATVAARQGLNVHSRA